MTADRRILAQQRHAEHRAELAERAVAFGVVNSGSVQASRIWTTPPLERDAADQRAAARRDRSCARDRFVFRRESRPSRPCDTRRLAADRCIALSASHSRAAVSTSVSSTAQIERRLADDLEHVAGRGLVFERFLQIARALAQFGEQPRVLHRDDRLARSSAPARSACRRTAATSWRYDADDAEQASSLRSSGTTEQRARCRRRARPAPRRSGRSSVGDRPRARRRYGRALAAHDPCQRRAGCWLPARCLPIFRRARRDAARRHRWNCSPS